MTPATGFARVVRCGRALVIHCGPRAASLTARLPSFTAADVATAWLAEYRAIREQSVRP